MVVLSSTSDNYFLEWQPTLSYEIRSFIIIEYRDLESIVIRRVVDSETQFLIPAKHVSQVQRQCGSATHTIVVFGLPSCLFRSS